MPTSDSLSFGGAMMFGSVKNDSLIAQRNALPTFLAWRARPLPARASTAPRGEELLTRSLRGRIFLVQQTSCARDLFAAPPLLGASESHGPAGQPALCANFDLDRCAAVLR